MLPKMPPRREETPPVKKEVPKLPREESESLLDLPIPIEDGEGKLVGLENQDLS